MRDFKISAPRNPKKQPAFKVRYSELDIVGHVNFAQYVKWILDSYKKEFIWKNSVASFEINFIAEVAHNEALSVLTEKLNDEEPTFLHSIERRGDNREVCRARVSWYPEKYGVLRNTEPSNRRA
jgi:acyl-ACP thioesterase